VEIDCTGRNLDKHLPRSGDRIVPVIDDPDRLAPAVLGGDCSPHVLILFFVP
jgi:hypothetical protein